MKKFEQDSCLDQQMSLAYSKVPCPGGAGAGGDLYIMGNASMEPPMNRMTDKQDWKYFILVTLLACGNKEKPGE